MSKLRPCSKCGDVPRIKVDIMTASVQCKKCNAVTVLCRRPHEADDALTKRAIESWNEWRGANNATSSQRPVKDITTVGAAPIATSEWESDGDYLLCTKCGVRVSRDLTFSDVGKFNYCPNCGAKMGDGNE